MSNIPSFDDIGATYGEHRQKPPQIIRTAAHTSVLKEIKMAESEVAAFEVSKNIV